MIAILFSVFNAMVVWLWIVSTSIVFHFQFSFFLSEWELGLFFLFSFFFLCCYLPPASDSIQITSTSNNSPAKVLVLTEAMPGLSLAGERWVYTGYTYQLRAVLWISLLCWFYACLFGNDIGSRRKSLFLYHFVVQLMTIKGLGKVKCF